MAAAEVGRFKSVDRVAAATRAALDRRFRLVEFDAHPAIDPRGFLEQLARRRSSLHCVFDMSAIALAGPAAPELPMVWWALGNLSHGATALSSRRRRLKSTDLLLVNCAADLEILRRTVTMGRPRARLVPFAVDTDLFRPATDEGQRRSIRTRLGLGSDRPLAVYSGRINQQKGLHHVLHLLASEPARSHELQLAIAGTADRTDARLFGVSNDGYPDYLQRLAGRLGVSSRVHYLGTLPDLELASLLRAADLFVSLSLHHDENFGFAPVEAMASGVPCIVTDWGGYRDTVLAPSCGYRLPSLLCRNGLRVAWRDGVPALDRLLSSRQLRTEMGAAGRARALDFSLEKFEERVAAAVEDAIEHSRGSTPAFGSDVFKFHKTALRLQARNAFIQLTHQRGDGFDPRLKADEYDIYRFFLGPYATRDVCDTQAQVVQRPRAVGVATPTKAGWTVQDPIWPVDIPATPEHAHLLEADGSQSLEEMATHSRLDLTLLLQATSNLARQGVLELLEPPEPATTP